jgi:hypothetical protein
MLADLLYRIGTSNGCTVGSSVHSVVVVGDLFRGHRLMGMREKSQGGREGNWKVLYSIGMVGSWEALKPILNRKERSRRSRCTRISQAVPVCVKNADSFNINQGGVIGHGNVRSIFARRGQQSYWKW